MVKSLGASVVYIFWCMEHYLNNFLKVPAITWKCKLINWLTAKHTTKQKWSIIIKITRLAEHIPQKGIN